MSKPLWLAGQNQGPSEGHWAQGDEALEWVTKAFWTDLNHLSLGYRGRTFDVETYLSLFIDEHVWGLGWLLEIKHCWSQATAER